MKTRALRDAIDTYNELLLIHQLNLELLTTLELTLLSIKEFCIKNNIPFGNSKIASLIGQVNSLLDEISRTDEFLHEDKSDADFTEPSTVKNISY